MILIAFWLFLTTPGFAFALLSLLKGRSFLRYLEKEHPELVPTYKIELARDALLTAVIGIMVVIGFAATLALTYGGLKAMTGIVITVGFYAMAILVDVLAIANYALRTGAVK